MFRPAVSVIFRRYYKNIKGKTDRTKEEAIPFYNIIQNWINSIYVKE